MWLKLPNNAFLVVLCRTLNVSSVLGTPCCLCDSQKAKELLWHPALFLPGWLLHVLIWLASSVFLFSLSRLSVCFDLCILSHFYMKQAATLTLAD